MFVSNLLLDSVSSASSLQLCCGCTFPMPLGWWCWRLHLDYCRDSPFPCPPLVVGLQKGKLPFYLLCCLTPIAERVCSILSACSSHHKGTAYAQFCASLPQCACSSQPASFQEKLEKPGDTRCLPLSVSWRDRIIHLSKLQLGTVNGEEPDWTFCASLLLGCVVLCSLAISRQLPILFQWPCLTFLVHRADSKT